VDARSSDALHLAVLTAAPLLAAWRCWRTVIGAGKVTLLRRS